MAKLKKFNNQTDYITYIGSDEFSAPDISTVILDVKYNPLSLFHVNAKQTISPTATTIPFIIDTITNGKVGVWWRPSTGTTYTKVNSVDLVFNSGFTQNKISDLVVNTKPVSTDYNNIYVVSAISDTNILINDTDTCIQYGLITLDSGVFNATGGSKTVQVKTAPENKWEITDIPSWLTFSQTTGIGATSITVTADNYTSTTTDRECSPVIKYIDIDFSFTAHFIQYKKIDNYYFKFISQLDDFNASDEETQTLICEMSGSTFGKTIYFIPSDSWIIVTPTSFVADEIELPVNVSVTKNSNRTPRTGTITARINSTTGTVLDSVTVNQKAAEKFFYVGSSVQNALSTSATSYSYPLMTSSSDTSTKTVYFATNLTVSEIESLDIHYNTDAIHDANINTIDSSITFSFIERQLITGETASTRAERINFDIGENYIVAILAIQAAPEYFKWDNLSVTVGYEGGMKSNTFKTNINTNDIVLTPTGTYAYIIESILINKTGTTFSVTDNATGSSRNCPIEATKSGIYLGSFNVVQQAPAPYFYTGEMYQTAATMDVNYSAHTNLEIQCYTNFSQSVINNITVSASTYWIAPQKLRWEPTSRKVYFNVAENQGVVKRVGTIAIYSGGTNEIGNITVNQGTKYYFKWTDEVSNSATTLNISSAATSASKSFVTNIPSIALEYSGMVTAATTFGENNIVARFTTTPVGSGPRYGVVYAKANSNNVGVWNLQQNENQPSPTTYTIEGTFTNESSVYFNNFWCYVDNTTHTELSTTLTWSVSTGKTIVETKSFDAYVGDEIKFTVLSHRVPASLLFESKSKEQQTSNDGLIVNFTMSSQRNFAAGGISHS